jgi:hypothetical protein
MSEPANARAWLRSVVSVGGGRGFVIQSRDGQRLVVTAAHCLTRGELYLPPALSSSDTQERTYANLLGLLGAEPTIWAECLFVAVLGSPDGQELYDEAVAYAALVEAAVPLKLGTLSFAPVRLPDGTEIRSISIAESDAWLLALSGHWFSCRVTSRGRSLHISGAAEGIRGGMSGSPIIGPDGRAIGVVCTSGGVVKPGQPDTGDYRERGPNPFLAANLPGWLVRGTRLTYLRRPRLKKAGRP